MKKLLFLASLALGASQLTAFTPEGSTVYFVITDRFCNGDSANDINYGRITDYGSERLNAATFHGGDLKGMLQKAREGYFRDLGVDVVWMTDVYEQIHGWMSGSGPVNDFPHYGYHGYYPLDYTQLDKNYGTAAELRELVDTLHAQGIRVMLGANINDPGYPTLLDAVQYGFASTGLTEAEAARHDRAWSYDRFFEGRTGWKGWYGREWVRMPDEGWDESNPLEATLFGMPDFKDENREAATWPEFLQRKWAKEGTANDAWVNPSARKLRSETGLDPVSLVIAAIASWVGEFGIDGMRCDIVENSRLDRWKELSEACNRELARWRSEHPSDPASKWTERFYMTGDYDRASIDYKKDYADAGFSSLVNFYFPKRGDLDNIVYTWQAYSDSMAAHPGWHPFSYLNNSYHRDADMERMADCATTLLLSPGVAQVFYGDETRRPLSDARLNVDADQAFRSDMNWSTADTALLAHFRRLGTIRRSHPAIAAGRQRTLDAHTCVRTAEGDTVLIRLRPDVLPEADATGVFADGTRLRELYTGTELRVENGRIRLPESDSGVAVIAKDPDTPGPSGAGRD